jgi:hypothetical protein
MDTLVRIKRCALANRIRLTKKARDELETDSLDLIDIRESLMNAMKIYKTIRSTNPRTHQREYLYIIQSYNFSGILIYTKGKLLTEQATDTFYLLVSGKRAL